MNDGLWVVNDDLIEIDQIDACKFEWIYSDQIHFPLSVTTVANIYLVII